MVGQLHKGCCPGCRSQSLVMRLAETALHLAANEQQTLLVGMSLDLPLTIGHTIPLIVHTYYRI